LLKGAHREEVAKREEHGKEIGSLRAWKRQTEKGEGVIGTVIIKLKEKIGGKMTGGLVDKCSRRWRILWMIGGLLSPGAALMGYLGDDERLAWAAAMFWLFSVVCLWGIAVGKVRKVGSTSEKILILTCGVLVCSSLFMHGLTLR